MEILSCRLFMDTVVIQTPEGPDTSITDNGDLFLMSADGTEEVSLVSGPLDDCAADWSPDGAQFVFVSEPHLVVSNAEGTDFKALATVSNPYWPAWSPDGSKIAFEGTVWDDGWFDIWVINVDGTDLTRLTSSPGLDRFPTWSPDGSKIAFMSNRHSDKPEEGWRGAEYEIYVMNADGSNVVRLTNDYVFDSWPDWSPDGSRIAFIRDGNIFTMSPSGTDLVSVTARTSGTFYPTWSPDGTRIAFSSHASELPPPGSDYSLELYVVDADGGNLIRLTYNIWHDVRPSWRSAGN